jgi:hypothetical protein
MLDIDVNLLEQTVKEAKETLREGLVATDIWDRETGLSLAGFNPQPEAVALFNQLTNEMASTLAGSNFPGLNRYFLLDLDGGNTVVCQKHGDDLMSGMLLDAAKVNLGILVSIVIPKYAAGVAAARNQQH